MTTFFFSLLALSRFFPLFASSSSILLALKSIHVCLRVHEISLRLRFWFDWEFVSMFLFSMFRESLASERVREAEKSWFESKHSQKSKLMLNWRCAWRQNTCKTTTNDKSLVLFLHACAFSVQNKMAIEAKKKARQKNHRRQRWWRREQKGNCLKWSERDPKHDFSFLFQFETYFLLLQFNELINWCNRWTKSASSSSSASSSVDFERTVITHIASDVFPTHLIFKLLQIDLL